MVQNSFRSETTLTYVEEKIHVSDPKMIQGLVDVITNAQPKLTLSSGLIATADILEITMKRSEVQIGWFRVVGPHILEIGEPSKFRRYACSDRNLLHNVRKAIGASVGDWEG
jgi:hypothetical protein